MKELEILLNKRWVLKSRDKETYYKLRDALGELRKFTTEKMGCQIIDNSLLIKMEKIPVIPESFMGDPEIFLKRRICISLYSADVSGRQRCTGAVYHITADGIYYSKSAWGNL